jgi:putative DNA primase/helicase
MGELAKFRSEAVLRGVLTHLRGQTEEEDAFETDWRIIHCANCVLVREADGFVTERFSPKFRSRSRPPIAYQAKADCPKFKDMILGHLSFEDREILQKLGGQCLVGTNLTQRVLMLDGEAGASKGAFVLILKGIVGSRNCRELRTKQLGEGRFEVGRFLGANLLLGADVPANFLSTEGASRVKSLVGGDLLEPELKTSNEHFYIHGNFNVIVTSNSRLRVRLGGDQSAWQRRLVIVRYDKPFTGKPVPNIHEILLAEEGSGILNFFIQALRNSSKTLPTKASS